MKNFLSLFAFIALLTSCTEKPNIVGLWEITSVTEGDEKNTPKGRWIHFHEDNTQESGNGWLQHSVGTWNLNLENNDLSIENSNGLKDMNQPFRISLSASDMTWSRSENGREVKIKLRRINRLPETDSDRLFGLWMLKNSTGDGDFFDAEAQGGVFFRWDKKFVMYTPNGQVHGVYNVHGHKPEVELIPYGEKERSWWTLEVDDTSLQLKRLNTDSLVTRSFERIYEFPED